MRGQSAAKKADAPQAALAGRVDWRVLFEWKKKGRNIVLSYIGKEKRKPEPNEFSLRLEDSIDNINKIEYAFSYHLTGYMRLDEFIAFLKGLGLSKANADKLRKEIAARHPNIKISFDPDLGDAAVPPTARVSGNADVAQADGERPIGEHSARVLRERQGTGPVTSDGAALPTSWQEARAQVPGLRKWVEVKREAGLTGRREGFNQEVYDLLVQHLRDTQTGLGRWATSKDGLPRNLLRHVDSGLRQEIYSLGNPELPPDISLPDGKPTGRPQGSPDHEKRAFAPRPNRQPRVEAPTREQLREARRIAKLGQRRGVRDGIDI